MAILNSGNIPMPDSGATFVGWFSQLAQYLPTFELPRVNNEEQWISAAEVLMRNPQCASLNCPWPRGFSNWRAWAQRWVAAFGGQI